MIRTAPKISRHAAIYLDLRVGTVDYLEFTRRILLRDKGTNEQAIKWKQYARGGFSGIQRDFPKANCFIQRLVFGMATFKILFLEVLIFAYSS